MTPTQLSEIKRVAEAATPGNWQHDLNGFIANADDDGEWLGTIAQTGGDKAPPTDEDLRNGDFIAMVNPKTTLSLLAALEASQARVEALLNEKLTLGFRIVDLRQALIKSEHALNYCEPVERESCAGKVTQEQSEEFKDEAVEAITEALDKTSEFNEVTEELTQPTT